VHFRFGFAAVAFAAILFGPACPAPSYAATVPVFGIPGIDGMNGVGGPGTDGGPGGPANAATPPNTDSSNTAIATGGNGGNGGVGDVGFNGDAHAAGARHWPDDLGQLTGFGVLAIRCAGVISSAFPQPPSD